MNVLPIDKHEYFEILLSAAQPVNRVYLPDVANLRYTHLRGITVYTPDDFATGIQQIALVPRAQLQRSWTTIQLYNGKQFVNNRPTLNFFLDNPTNTVSQRNIRDFLGQQINYPKSYIDFAPSFIPATDLVIAVSIYYQDVAKVAKEDKKAAFNKRS